MIPDEVSTVNDVYHFIIELNKRFPKKCWPITKINYSFSKLLAFEIQSGTFKGKSQKSGSRRHSKHRVNQGVPANIITYETMMEQVIKWLQTLRICIQIYSSKFIYNFIAKTDFVDSLYDFLTFIIVYLSRSVLAPIQPQPAFSCDDSPSITSGMVRSKLSTCRTFHDDLF